jgi:hypothetical protein
MARMTLDDLKKPWMAEVSDPSGMPLPEALRSGLARARRDVRMRDFWMIFPLILVAGGAMFFNWLTRGSVSVQSRIGVMSIVILAGVVTVVLLYARRTLSYDDLTLKSRLEREIEMLGRQVFLLLNVGYWFLLPLLLTVVISSLMGQHGRTGSYLPGPVLWVLYVAMLFISALAVWLCRREAQRTFLPLLSRLKQVHRDLVSPSAGTPHAGIVSSD